MKLTVLGSAGTHCGPGRACSSYLVEAEGTRLLLDCGNGSQANLYQHADVADLDAILISHLHADHFADVYGLYYALRFHPGGPASVPLIGPAGAEAFITQLLPEESAQTFSRHLPTSVAQAGETLSIGALRVTLFASAHPLETLASRVEADGQVLAYSADSGPTEQLVACARDADLFVCDGSWLEPHEAHPRDLHMTGRQAGQQAAAAGAARLLITHVYPTIDPQDVVAEATEVFGGEVLAAVDHQELQL